MRSIIVMKFLELIRKSQKVVEQHRKFIQAGKGIETDDAPESNSGGIQSLSSTNNVTVNPTTGVSVVVDGGQLPDPQVLRSTEATELDARRDERRRRQAELGTDDEADETMIKEKKRKIVKKPVEEEQPEQDKKLVPSSKKHEKKTSEVPKPEEPQQKAVTQTMEMLPKARLHPNPGTPSLPTQQRPPLPAALEQPDAQQQPTPDTPQQQAQQTTQTASRPPQQPLTLSRLGPKSPIVKRTLKMKDKDKPEEREEREHRDEGTNEREGRDGEVGVGVRADGQGVGGVAAAGVAGEAAGVSPAKVRKAENLLIQPQVKFGQSIFLPKKPSDAPPAVNLVIRKPLGIPPPTENASNNWTLKKPGLSTDQKPASDTWNDDFMFEGSSGSKPKGRTEQPKHENEDWDV